MQINIVEAMGAMPMPLGEAGRRCSDRDGQGAIHFGIIVNLSIGTLTPPVGTVMLMVCNIAKVRVSDFTRQAFSMYAGLFAFLLLVTYI
ncbi:MAG: TRAP transporter large permease subunit, partial [Phyllobacterium sp.]